MNHFSHCDRRSLIGLALAGVVLPLRAFAAPDEAARLAQSVYDRPGGSDLTSVARMDLVERGRPPRQRVLVTYRQRRASGETVNLIRFLDPADIAGTGLLSVTQADGTTEQSLYLPGLDRVRRISSDRRGGRFVGSDLYYEDLRERRPSLDRHRLLGQETLDGVACQVLESTPVDAGESVYRRRVSWIDPQTLLARRVDYYERDDAKPGKRWVLLTAKRVQGYWTVTDSRMTDLGSGHETRLAVETALYDRKLPARLFTAQALADESIESEYRP